jgi:hypothetical protein
MNRRLKFNTMLKSIFVLPLLLARLWLSTSALNKEVVEYEWLSRWEVTGSQIVQYENNNVTINFEFSDRGLGPKLVDKILLSKKGIIVKQTLSEHSFMGSAVSEVR